MLEPVVVGGATLYLGDCREVLPTLTGVDALIADPPYGVRERTMRKSNGRSRTGAQQLQGTKVESRDWPAVLGDDEPFDPSHLLHFKRVILFGANHYSHQLPGSSCWLVWDKREETTPDDNADCEIAWTNLKGPARIHRQLWRGICRRGEENIARGEKRLHPTQKPVALMVRAIELCRLPPNSLIVDPYMGCGPVIVAALRLGHRVIGCEKVPEYFDTAASRAREELERIKAESRQAVLFPPAKLKQGNMFDVESAA